VRVFSEGHEPLRLRFGELPPEVRAAVVGLDPLGDREEYGLFAQLAEDRESLAGIREATAAEPSNEGHDLGLRIDNLDVGRWGIWAGQEETSVLDALRAQCRAAVVDISGPDTPEEQAVVAGAVLEHLWRRREERRPTLVVIDEAHNVCPATPASPLQARARDHVVRIAGEGRKYGLYLLLVTQRPDKLEDNALTQCDNVVLMRLNGAADAARLAGAFSFIPPSLIAEAPTFVKGEGLIVGGIAGRPMRVRFGTRLSEEGGGDVPTTWAQARG
jgi:ATPase family associated with various cellular activities (AAA)